ncbi:MAG: HAMP domain-containing histidine kinase [Flavobacteriales bacterium]|nr:HAMP domain-containing histidine kinase [Flavobacteriales bacterium]
MKHFRLKLIVLFLLLFASLTALASIFGRADYFFTQLVLIAIIILLAWQCFYTIDTSHREINKFLFALKYLDASVSFPKQSKNSFQKLYDGLNNAMKELTARAEQKDLQKEWMEHIIQRMPIGVMLIQDKNQILFTNELTLEFLSIPNLKRLDQLESYQKDLVGQILNSPYGHAQKVTLENNKEAELYKVGFQQENKLEILFIHPLDELKGPIEMDAWMKLIRVLTHEIMNSISSISSLASTLHESIKSENLSSDMQLAAESIEKRSQNLIQFTESYRKVSDIRAAQKTWFILSEIVKAQAQFLKADLDSISIGIDTDEKQQIFADQQQIEQVIINLFLNAKIALQKTEKPSIYIKVCQEKTSCHLSFTDNGVGIQAKDQNHIFVPFYTTRSNGKGIGLSLCRQFMHNNNGSISLKESKVGNTTFLLRFKA